MYQGQELYERLNIIYDIMNIYSGNVSQYLLMSRKIKEEKQYIDAKSMKGKRNLIVATAIVCLLVFCLLLSLLSRDFSVMWQVIVLIIAYFVCKNTYPKISIIPIILLSLLLITYVTMAIAFALQGDLLGIVVLVFAVSAAVVIVIKALKFNRSYVDSFNKDVQKYNEPYIQEYWRLYTECQKLEKELWAAIQGWYPPDYVYVDAVSFFIKAMRNGRADTMKELLNLYDAQVKYDEIVRNQQMQIELTRAGIESFLDSQRNIEQQLRFNNILGLYQAFQLYDIRQNLA